MGFYGQSVVPGDLGQFEFRWAHLVLGADRLPPWPLLASLELGQEGPNWSHVLWAVEALGGLNGPQPANQRGWAGGQRPQAQNQENGVGFGGEELPKGTNKTGYGLRSMNDFWGHAWPENMGVAQIPFKIHTRPIGL
ncbi:hypothetical protein O181_016128 [Austropuccinia psidii MF-1]|uniref:Uncharacterized protein n=1 Tax=Austropuccinia psidii MF-1 TaxID=1389203 RepID=A0A9Q3C4J4_9BASI|nr:hypothetical protein [Austropuccinia psidii MF-1]